MYSNSKKSNNPISLPPEVNEALDQEPEGMGDELRHVWDITGAALHGSSTSSEQEVDAMWAKIKAHTQSRTLDTINPTSLPPELNEALDQEAEHMGDELRRVWDITGTALHGSSTSSEQEVDAMWARLKAQTLQQSPTPSTSTKRSFNKDREPVKAAPTRRPARVPSKARWLVPAFCIAILVGFATYWYTPVTVTADRGEFAEAQLPDGSVILLNSGSSLSYKRGFDGNPFSDATVRSVQIKGEGYFDVAHSDIPFNVETFNANVQVLGTEFNVRAWPLEPEQESTISLKSGRVAVSKVDQTGTRVILEEPGESAVVRTSYSLSSKPFIQDIESVISWRDRGLTIKSKTLTAVFDELERRYDVKISVVDTQILNDSLTLLMPNPDNVESILNDICIDRNLKFRKTSRGYVIYRSPSVD